MHNKKTVWLLPAALHCAHCAISPATGATKKHLRASILLRRRPAHLPHADGPVAAAGQEEVGRKGRPLQRVHWPDVAAVRLQVLLAVAGAALVDVAVLRACT